MKKIKTIKLYETPVTEVVDVEVEKGFAVSQLEGTGEYGGWQ